MHRPAITFLVTAERSAIEARMLLRPPQHRYEADVEFLLAVQEEYLRLADYQSTIVIDTSSRDIQSVFQLCKEKMGIVLLDH